MTQPAKSLSVSFWALNVAQMFGAMNDNLFRWVMALSLVARASDPVNGVFSAQPIFIAGIVFATPFILFSSFAGILADRFSKRQIIVIAKAAEVIVAGLGILAFISNQPFFLYSVMFLLTTHSAFFAPCKYGIIPEIVPEEKLSYANGLIGLFTYLSIILGTIGGGALFHAFRLNSNIPHASTSSCWRGSAVCFTVAILGFIASLLIKDTGARAAGKTGSPLFWVEATRTLRKIRPNKYVFLTIFALAYFLFLGGYVQLNIVDYAVGKLKMKEDFANYIFLALAFGIGGGSYWAGKLSGRSIEIGLVPAGSLICSLALMLLLIPGHSLILVILILLAMGIGGGFFNVPLNAFIQEESPEKDRGEIIATMNFLSFCGVALASAVLFLMDLMKIDPAMRFFLLGVLTLALTGYVIYTLPDFFVRFLGLIVTRIAYRLEVEGAENVPLKGGALLVANHVSYADAVLLMATQQRRVRFLADRGIYNTKGFNWLFRILGTIPISEHDNPKDIIRSLQTARQAIEEGWLVCIFAEGGLTRTGYIMEFKKGFEHIMRGSKCPIIPVDIHGVWGSIFSYGGGRLFHHIPRITGRRILISFGAPLPPDATAFRVRQTVMELESRAFLSNRHLPLPLEFISMARQRWGAFCMSDTLGRRLTFGRTLTGTIILADILKREIPPAQRVGVILPSSVGGALANIALLLMDRIPVNLNYTASRASIDSSIQQCEIQSIITSRNAAKRLNLEDLPGLVFIEDLMKKVTTGLKIRSFLVALLCPRRFMGEYGWRVSKQESHSDDTAAIIFSSGSTGEPKGVELSHYNIHSNVEAIQQIFRLERRDVMCGILPFFHSFGFTGTLWLPLLAGIGVAYHYNPTEAETVGKLVAENDCTMLVATPTFLGLYTRKVPRENFASLRLVVTGAEKLKEKIAAAFQEKFGILPLEGYGATELSPVASVNVPNVEIGGVRQEATKAGSIGRPIPGITMKIVDPENLDHELDHGIEGMLLVKGPNVMKGYLNKPEKTAEVMQGDWYVTGDLARIDHDGFVTITDRLSRFSKIGGEMIPHLAIEEKIQEAAGATEMVCAVTSIPDESKGERLVALLTPVAGDVAELRQLLKDSGLPNLWIPSRDSFIQVDQIPMLGSGKVDLKKIRDLAIERTK